MFLSLVLNYRTWSCTSCNSDMFYSKGQKPKTISRFKFEEFQHPEYHHGFCQHQVSKDLFLSIPRTSPWFLKASVWGQGPPNRSILVTNLRKSSRAACCCLFHLHTHLLAHFELLTRLHSKCARDLPHQASQILEPESAQLTELKEPDTQVSKSLPLSPSVSVFLACSRVWHSEIEVLERRDCASQLQQEHCPQEYSKRKNSSKPCRARKLMPLSHYVVAPLEH